MTHPIRTGWLASVADEAEIALVRAARPDIIDLKDPSRGALGAWPAERVAAVVRAMGSDAARPRLSATIGDLPMEPTAMLAAARAMAATGVDYVKAGIAPAGPEGGDPLACLEALGSLAADGVRLVAVFFADLWPGRTPLEAAARAGFAGVMLDTATKGRSLREGRGHEGLTTFVEEARALGLMSGLAGSLRLPDIAPLRAAGADYLGFRGALCGARGRTGAIDPTAVARVAAAMTAALPASGAPSGTGASRGPFHKGSSAEARA